MKNSSKMSTTPRKGKIMKEFDEGYAAFFSDMELKNCPYKGVGSESRMAWQDGWVNASIDACTAEPEIYD